MNGHGFRRLKILNFRPPKSFSGRSSLVRDAVVSSDDGDEVFSVVPLVSAFPAEPAHPAHTSSAARSAVKRRVPVIVLWFIFNILSKLFRLDFTSSIIP